MVLEEAEPICFAMIKHKICKDIVKLFTKVGTAENYLYRFETADLQIYLNKRRVNHLAIKINHKSSQIKPRYIIYLHPFLKHLLNTIFLYLSISFVRAGNDKIGRG